MYNKSEQVNKSQIKTKRKQKLFSIGKISKKRSVLICIDSRRPPSSFVCIRYDEIRPPTTSSLIKPKLHWYIYFYCRYHCITTILMSIFRFDVSISSPRCCWALLNQPWVRLRCSIDVIAQGQQAGFSERVYWIWLWSVLPWSWYVQAPTTPNPFFGRPIKKSPSWTVYDAYSSANDWLWVNRQSPFTHI
jgi:hypothetical protein